MASSPLPQVLGSALLPAGGLCPRTDSSSNCQCFGLSAGLSAMAGAVTLSQRSRKAPPFQGCVLTGFSWPYGLNGSPGAARPRGSHSPSRARGSSWPAFFQRVPESASPRDVEVDRTQVVQSISTFGTLSNQVSRRAPLEPACCVCCGSPPWSTVSTGRVQRLQFLETRGGALL